jgi:hypothetical protein
MRLQAEEKEAFEKAVDLTDYPLSACVSGRLRHAAIKALHEVGHQVALLQNARGERSQ